MSKCVWTPKHDDDLFLHCETANNKQQVAVRWNSIYPFYNQAVTLIALGFPSGIRTRAPADSAQFETGGGLSMICLKLDGGILSYSPPSSILTTRTTINVK